jgi:hypothetical protein
VNRRPLAWLALTPLLPLLAALVASSAGGGGAAGAAAAGGAAGAFRAGAAWALPLLAPLTLYPAFVARVRERDYFAAWKVALLWALLLSAGVIALVLAWPAGARAGIWHGEAYRREMFGWIATGRGAENDWRAFLPQHALHLGLFLALTWVSGGYLGLALGAALVGYMSDFVGSYAALCAHPTWCAVAAWVPWSVLRVLAFVLLGAVFSRPLLVRRAWPFGRAEIQLMALAASGLAADAVLKALFAPSYGRFLRQVVHDALPALYSAAQRIVG